ncbi:MAG: diguanylate cyclase [Devosiaceae bacterium]
MSQVGQTLSALVSPASLADAHRRALDAHSIVSVSDTRGRISYVNDRFCQVMQYERAELVGQSYAIINGKQHDPGFFEELWSCVNAGKSWVGEVCNKTKSGELRWFDNIVVPLFDGAGQVSGHFSVRKDITKRKTAEKKLQRSQAFLEDVSEIAKVGGWTLDLQTGALFWSRQTKIIHEVDPDYTPKLDRAIEFYAPEARSTITHAVETSISDGSAWDLELPMITATGRSIWVRAVGHTVHEDGEAVSVVGAFQDITTRKLAEDVLRAEVTQRHSAEQLLRDVLETMPDAVAAYDDDDRLIICNSAYLETYAASADAIVPGATFESILRCGLARGQYQNIGSNPARQEAWLAERLEHHKNPPEQLNQRLANGTWLQVREHRSPTGTTVGVRSDITDLKRAEAELRKIAECDQLTGLLNRRSFCARLDELLDTVAEGGTSGGCVALFDIDHFKPINDAYGHDVGDEVLRQIARRMQAILGPDDFVARLGGDEFVFALSGGETHEAHENVILHLFEAMREPMVTSGATLRVGISLGAAAINDTQTSSASLLKYADLAQYRAKQDGRGNWRWFSDADAAAVRKKNDMAQALSASICAEQDLSIAFAPIACAQDGQAVGFSNELSWRFGEETLRSNQLFELTQKTGQIAELCTRSMDVALATIGNAQDIGAETGQLWISASPDHMRLDPFVSTLDALRKQHALAPHMITIAVDQTTLTDRSASAIEKTMKMLGELGYRLGIDDFGSGASSLATLQKLGIHAVRLCTDLTNNLEAQGADHQLVRGTIAMAKALQIEIIAKDVSLPKQAALLAGLGCDALQGSLVGDAVKSDDLQLYLAENARAKLASLLDETRLSASTDKSDAA